MRIALAKSHQATRVDALGRLACLAIMAQRRKTGTARWGQTVMPFTWDNQTQIKGP